MTTVTMAELEADLEALLARAAAGETVLVARDGQAVLQIVRCPQPWERELGIRPAIHSMSEIQIPAIPLDGPLDSVDLIRKERMERDRLP